MALRVGTIQKAFEGVEAKYGVGRILGRFSDTVLSEPRATATFLHQTLEHNATDFGPFFGNRVNWSPGYDPSRYAPDNKLNQVIGELAQAWKEAQSNAPFDGTTALQSFTAGDWGQDPAFPNRFGAAVGKLQNAPALRAYTMRYFHHASAPPAERPQVGGHRAMKLFRGLLSNASKLKESGGITAALRTLADEYAVKKGFPAGTGAKEFPKFTGLEKGKFGPEQFARFLEARLSQDFAEVTPNTASYFLRDLAKKGGGQLMGGSEFAFLADRDTTIFITRSGLQGDVAPKVVLTTLGERELREIHQKAIELVQTEFIQTPAELSERMALAARERLV